MWHDPNKVFHVTFEVGKNWKVPKNEIKTHKLSKLDREKASRIETSFRVSGFIMGKI